LPLKYGCQGASFKVLILNWALILNFYMFKTVIVCLYTEKIWLIDKKRDSKLKDSRFESCHFNHLFLRKQEVL